MSAVFWFFLGSFITACLWYIGAWYTEWRDERERVKQAEQQVVELWFGGEQ